MAVLNRKTLGLAASKWSPYSLPVFPNPWLWSADLTEITPRPPSDEPTQFDVTNPARAYTNDKSLLGPAAIILTRLSIPFRFSYLIIIVFVFPRLGAVTAGIAGDAALDPLPEGLPSPRTHSLAGSRGLKPESKRHFTLGACSLFLYPNAELFLRVGRGSISPPLTHPDATNHPLKSRSRRSLRCDRCWLQRQ